MYVCMYTGSGRSRSSWVPRWMNAVPTAGWPSGRQAECGDGAEWEERGGMYLYGIVVVAGAVLGDERQDSPRGEGVPSERREGGMLVCNTYGLYTSGHIPTPK